MSFWYHFAIMFEALFILTTIDAGTRVARFMVQEFGGRVWKKFEHPDWLPGNIIATTLVVCSWGYFIWTGNISTIWPMFGTANQLLAAVALSVTTTVIMNSGKERYAWVTFLPMLFVAATTLTAGVLNITENFWPMTRDAGSAVQGYVNTSLTFVMIVCAVVVLIEAFRRWYSVLAKGERIPQPQPVEAGQEKPPWPPMRCC